MLCSLIKFCPIACSRALIFDLLFLDFDDLLLGQLDDDLGSWPFICFTLIFIVISSNLIRQEIANWIVHLGVELKNALFDLITYLVGFGLRNLFFFIANLNPYLICYFQF